MKMLVIYTDGDSKVFHPVTGEKLDDCGRYKYLFALTERNYGNIIGHLLNNDFKFSKRFFNTMLGVMDEVVNIVTDMEGEVNFANYTIGVKTKLPIIEIE